MNVTHFGEALYDRFVPFQSQFGLEDKMRRTLDRESNRAEIVQRLANLTPAAQRQWGSMSVSGMICHLCDSYRMAMGEMQAQHVKMPLPPAVVKFISLRLPVTWPKGIPTVNEIKQGEGGTAPGEFAQDQDLLLNAFARFCASSHLTQAHPMFGPMRQQDWLRWGYLHADHHLRQFSA